MKKKKTPPPSSGNRICIYARKSNLKEESRGRSVKEQVNACKRAAQSMGYEVDESMIFIDNDGAKGYHHFQDLQGHNPGPHRAALTALIRNVEANNVDICICWRLERIARDEIVAALTFRKIAEFGVRLFVLTQDKFVHTSDGYTNAIGECNHARAYSEKLSDDVCRHHETNVKCGLPAGNPSMFGFRSAGIKTLKAVPVESELVTVRRIFNWYVYGPDGESPMSCGAIAKRLEAEGIGLSVGSKGHKILYPHKVSPGRVTTILRNAAYNGHLEYNGEYYPTKIFHVPSVDGTLEPTISDDLWHKAQQKLDGKIVYPRGDQPKLFSGILICPDCGRKSYLQSRGKIEGNYYCSYRGGRDGCHGTSYRTVKGSIFRRWFDAHLAPLIAGEIIALRAERSGEPLRRELGALELQASKIATAETQVLANAVMAGLDHVQISAVAAKFRSERQIVEKRIAELKLRLRSEESGASLKALDLVDEDEATVRLALARHVKWCALTTRGVVVYLRSGSIIGARYKQPKHTPRQFSHVTEILPPTVHACEECLTWIDHPDRFLDGLRRPTVYNSKQIPDCELVPADILLRVQAVHQASESNHLDLSGASEQARAQTLGFEEVA
jgi:DNA invertase Pin-like site-specific DNA recombinase